jgi:hypothetical protein
MQFYAQYESQLTSSSNDLASQLTPDSNESETAITGLSISELLMANKSAINDGLTKNLLTSAQALQIENLKKDLSPYELSYCNTNDTEIPPDCKVGNRNPGTKRVALIGDSKMAMFAQPIIEYFTARNWLVVPMAMSGCHMSDMADSEALKNCKQRSNWVYTNIAEEKYDLVISAEWPSNTAALRNINLKYWNNIIANSRDLVILQQIPKVLNPADCVKKDYTFPTSCQEIPKELSVSWNYTLNLLNSLSSVNVHVIKSFDWFCSSNKCPYLINNMWVTRDGSHLTYSFVKKIAPIIIATLDAIIK